MGLIEHCGGPVHAEAADDTRDPASWTIEEARPGGAAFLQGFDRPRSVEVSSEKHAPRSRLKGSPYGCGGRCRNGLHAGAGPDGP